MKKPLFTEDEIIEMARQAGLTAKGIRQRGETK